MYKKFVFLGLGGSGGKTLRFLKHEIRRWMDENGAEDLPIPSGWQFLHIDTPTVADGVGVGPGTKPLSADEYLGLVSPGVSFEAIATMLDSNQSMHEEIQTWRVEPAALGVSISEGAGQYRAVGKMISLAYLSKIKDKIKEAIDRTKNNTASSELALLYSKMTGETASKDSELNFVIVSSLAGGSGAGLLFPVSDLLRALETKGHESYGILYTPEVFSNLEDSMISGTQPNSLAAISELLNGYWWGGTSSTTKKSLVPPKKPPSLTLAGAPKAITGSGPGYPFLIGRTNASGVAFDKPEDLYQMVGRSLVSWVVSPEMSDQLVAHVRGNWQNASAGHFQADVLVGGMTGFDSQALEYEIGNPCFSGMGFSRLSIGSDWFGKYSARRIGYEGLRFIVRNHIESDEAKGYIERLNIQDPSQIAEKIAENQVTSFLAECNLSELGPDQNQIQESLIPETSNDLSLKAYSEAYRLSELGSSETRSASNWSDTLLNSIEYVLGDYKDKYITAIDASLKKWIEEVPQRVVQIVENKVAQFGLKVTAAIVRQAAFELETKVAPELGETDYLRFLEWGNGWRSQVSSEFSGVSGRISASDSRLDQALSKGLQYGCFIGNAKLAEKASFLVHDFANSFLRPLASSLEQSFQIAEKEWGSLSGWPEWNALNPPREVCPPISETVLIESGEYKELFNGLLRETLNAQDETAKELVRRAIVSGEEIRKDLESQSSSSGGKTSHDLELLVAVRMTSKWWPASGVVNGEVRPKTQASFVQSYSAEDLESRASHWLRRPQLPFSAVLDSGLREYLDDSVKGGNSQVSLQVYSDRRQRFLAKLGGAIQQSAPLIRIDANTMSLVHPQTAVNSNRYSVTSQIPLRGHVIESEVKQLLASYEFSDSDINKLMGSDSKLRHVDFSSILWPPHSPLVIDSLMKPIAEDWNQEVISESVASFWSRRRATKISEFVPAPQATIYAMARGWLTAGLMGQLDRKSSPMRISDGLTTSFFPAPNLSTSAYADDHLTQILELLPIAYVQVSLLGSLEPLAAYKSLRDLGKCASGSMYEYLHLNPHLAKFIKNGPNGESIGTPLANGSNPTERAKNAVTALEAYQEKIKTVVIDALSERSTNPTKLSRPPLLTGTWTIVGAVIDDLIRVISTMGVSATIDGL